MVHKYPAKITNGGAAPMELPGGISLGIGESAEVFLRRAVFGTPFDWAGAFANGLTATDFEGAPIENNQAICSIFDLQERAQKFGTDLDGATRWNIEIYPLLVAAVRAEILKTDLGEFGTTWQAVVQKMQGASGLILLGMLNEARATLLATPADLFLTAERLTRWANACHSADAIKEVE